jgi:hypothetical protein
LVQSQIFARSARARKVGPGSFLEKWPYLRPVPLGFALAAFSWFYVSVFGVDDVVQVGSYHLKSGDLTAYFLGFSLFFQRWEMRPLAIGKLALMAFIALSLLNLVRGSAADSFQAFEEMRPRVTLLLFAVLIVFAGSKVEPIENFRPWFVTFAAGFCGLFVLRELFGPTLFASVKIDIVFLVREFEGRMLGAAEAFFLACASTFFLSSGLRTSNRRRRNFDFLLSFATFSVCLVSRERSASAAAVAGMLVLVTTEPRILRRSPLAIILTLAAAALVLLLLLFEPWSDLFGLLPASFQESLTNTDTLGGREQVWQFAMEQRYSNWDLIRQLFGRPAGEAEFLATSAGAWGNSVHSQYIMLLMDYGAAGALIFAIWIGDGILRAFGGLARSGANAAGAPYGLCLAWLASLLVYGFAYEWHDWSGFIFAMALAASSPRAGPQTGRGEDALSHAGSLG